MIRSWGPLLAIAALLCSLPNSLWAQQTPAETLLSAYASQCPNVLTQSVRGSLLSVQNLASVVEEFKADNNCFGASSVGNVVASYDRLYQEYEVYQSDSNSRTALEHRMASYTNMLADPSLTTEERTFLANELLLAQADLINMEAEVKRFGLFSSRYATGASTMLSGVEGFLGSWASNPACFNGKNYLLASLLSNSLMSAAAFSAPGTRLALSSAAVVVQTLSKYIHDFKLNKDIAKLDDIKLPLAISCVSEALANQFCEANETMEVVDQFREDLDASEPQFEGLELLSYHLTELGHWLSEVYAGSAITSEGDLVNREKPILQAEFLQKVRRYTQTFATLRQRIFEGINSSSDRSEAIALAISSLVSIMENPSLTPGQSHSWSSSSSSSVENPIFVSRDRILLPYKLYDETISSVPLCTGDQPCQSLLHYVRSKNINLTLSDWARAVNAAVSVINETLDVVNLERARTISVDSYSVLVRANRDFRGEANAIQGLIKVLDNAKRIEDVLYDVGCRLSHRGCNGGEPGFTHRYYPQIVNVRRTAQLTDTVLNLIEEGFRPGPIDNDKLPKECRSAAETLRTLGIEVEGDELDNKSFTITSCVTNILKLAERGNDVYFSKVRDMVSYELEARFAAGDFSDNVEDILMATRSDLVSTLLNSYATQSNSISLAEVYQGLQTTKTLTRKTFDQFMEIFEKPVIKGLKRPDMSKDEVSAYCFRLLPYLENQKDDFIKDIYETCENAELKFYENGPRLKWTHHVVNYRSSSGLRRQVYAVNPKKSREDRFCAYRQYMRKNRLIEQRRTRRHAVFKEDLKGNFSPGTPPMTPLKASIHFEFETF